MDKFRPQVIVMDDVEGEPMVATYPNLCRMADELIADVLDCADAWEKNIGKMQTKREIRIIRLATRRGGGHTHCLEHLVSSLKYSGRILVFSRPSDAFESGDHVDWAHLVAPFKNLHPPAGTYDFILLDAAPLNVNREAIMEECIARFDFKVMVVLG